MWDSRVLNYKKRIYLYNPIYRFMDLINLSFDLFFITIGYLCLIH